MKYTVSLFFLWILAIHGTAQSKFSAGILISPELGSFSHFGYSKPEYSFGYTGGLQVRYHVSPSINLSSGIQYSGKGLATNQTVYDQNGFVLGTDQARYTFRFLEIPVLLSYSSNSDSRFSFYASAGLVPGYLMSEKARIPDIAPTGFVTTKDFEFNRHDLNNRYKKMILSGFIGIGGTIKLSEKISLLIQPNFKYALTRLDKDYNPGMGIFPIPAYQANYHPYTLGLLTGIFYKF